MHLAVDALGVKHSGGAVVLLDFLRAALDDARVSRLTVFCSPQSRRSFDLPASPKLRAVEQALAESSYLYRLLWFEHQLGSQCGTIGADVLLCMVGAGKASRVCPHVTFIQQSLPFLAGYRRTVGLKDRLRLATIEHLMRSSCRSAGRVIVQTPTMKAWLAQRLAIGPDRVDVAMPNVQPFALSAERRASAVLGPGKGPKLLFVGNDAPYKNVETVLAAMPALRQSFPDATLHLTWPPGHRASKQVGVVCLGYLPRDLLGAAYREATALVMPSSVETVGLPMLEAMSVGLPVLVADRPYAHDICEDAALFFDPRSTDDFVRAARSVLSDDGLRRHLAEAGKSLTARRILDAPYAKMVDIVIKASRRQVAPGQQSGETP